MCDEYVRERRRPGGTFDHRGRRRRHPRSCRDAARIPSIHPLRQYSGVHRHCHPWVVPVRGNGCGVHRAREFVAERLRGELQCARPRRALEPRDLRHVREARVLYRDWRHRYNNHHPHSSLGWLTPAAFAAAELAKTPQWQCRESADVACLARRQRCRYRHDAVHPPSRVDQSPAGNSHRGWIDKRGPVTFRSQLPQRVMSGS